MRASRRVALLLTASPLVMALAAAALADTPGLPGHVSLQGFGGDSQGGAFSAWLPVVQAPASVTWASPYSIFSDAGTAAGFGVGYRTVVSPKWAGGAYAFIDGSAGRGESWLWQGAFGVEALSSEVQARANVYVPLSGSTLANGFDVAAASLNADNMLEITRGHRYGAYGIDGEVGYRFLKWGAIDRGDGLRGFAGAFTSWRDGYWRSGFQGRLEAKFTSATSGVALKLSAGASQNDVAGTQWVVGAGLTMPLGPSSLTGGGGDDGVATLPLDSDPVHHLGALNIVVGQTEAAYYLNGRATGQVRYADGDDAHGVNGLSPDDATSLATAVTNAQVNGVIVALGQSGDIDTEGQTLLEGQALVGGGAYLPLATADGTTGFYWHADGTQGTIGFYNTAGGYALTLADYNSVIGTKIQGGPGNDYDTLGAIDGIDKHGLWITDNDIQIGAMATGSTAGDATDSNEGDVTGSSNSAPVIDSIEFYGINLAGSYDAVIANNDVEVAITATGGMGGSATAATDFGGNATGGDGGAALNASTVVGILLDGSTRANAYDNHVNITITATGGDGGEAIAGSGSETGAPDGTAKGGNAGAAAISSSSIYGISLASAGGARIDNNNVSVDVTATGGAGGKATIQEGASSEPSTGGASTGGNGGAGLAQAAVAGIYAGSAQPGVVISNNIVGVTVHAYGGAGGEGIGGQGGFGDDAGDGGAGTGGNGASGVKQSTSIVGIDDGSGSGTTITDNTVTMLITATGGAGGAGTGGTASAGDDSSGNGGKGTGGNGSSAFEFSELAGLNFGNTTNAIIAGNAVLVDATITGGAGGPGSGGGTINFDHSINGQGGDAVSGAGGDGLNTAVIAGEYGWDAQHLQLTNESILVDLGVTGGAGGGASGTAGGYSSGVGGVPGNGGSGTAGDGGDALESTVVFGLTLGQSNNSIVAGASILVDVTATSGNGGGADGGAGGYGDVAGSVGGAATGGTGGGITAVIAAFSGQEAEDLTVSDLTSYLYATVKGGTGGYGTGGAGGESENGTGGAGGNGTGGNGAPIEMLAANIDLRDATNVAVTNSVLHTEVTITGGAGGVGTGGEGGESDTGTGGAGGQGNGGDGGRLGSVIEPLFVATVVVDNSDNVSLITAQGDFIVTENGGKGGDGNGGNGGSHNGGLGAADAGEGGVTNTHTQMISSNGGTTGLVVDDFNVNQSAVSSDGAPGTLTNGTPGAP